MKQHWLITGILAGVICLAVIFAIQIGNDGYKGETESETAQPKPLEVALQGDIPEEESQIDQQPLGYHEPLEPGEGYEERVEQRTAKKLEIATAMNKILQEAIDAGASAQQLDYQKDVRAKPVILALKEGVVVNGDKYRYEGQATPDSYQITGIFPYIKILPDTDPALQP